MTDTTDNHTTDAEGDAYRWALRVSAMSVAALAVVGAVVAGLVRGGEGVWGAVAGAALAALGALVTQAAMVVGYRRPAQQFASIVGGSWLVKMVVILGGMLALTRVAGIDRPSFGAVALAGIVATLGIDLIAVRKARIPYAATGSKSGAS